MKIAIASDAWAPQVNGVVRTLAATLTELDRVGHEVELITPDRFLTVPLPGYASIRLAVAPRFGVQRMLDAFQPEVVHISTEGPIGWSVRGWCLRNDVPFTTAFHTRFPDYAAVRTGINAERFWPIMRRFHAPASAVLVATRSLANELKERGFGATREWSRGIDHWQFRREGDLHPAFTDLPRPVLINVGRVSAEKNLEAFLDLPTEGSKVIIGDGPQLNELRARYPDAHFLGAMAGEELAAAYRSADCFVFPSCTDTFGLVVIEALASGLPVAAYPVAGPLDILGPEGRGVDGHLPAPVGALDENLGAAVTRALQLEQSDTAAFAQDFTWQNATMQFLAALRSAKADWSMQTEAPEIRGATALSPDVAPLSSH